MADEVERGYLEDGRDLRGVEHPDVPGRCRPSAQGRVARCWSAGRGDGEVLVTDAEVLQEILHRYVAIDRRDAIGPAFDALLGVVDEVFPVEREDVERARRLVQTTRLSARDAVHVAIMRRRGIGGS